MKIKTLSLTWTVPGFNFQNCIMASDGTVSVPLVYLHRPTWIKSDEQWAAICAAVTISLPVGFEVTQ